MSKRSHASLRRTSDLTKLCPGSASHGFHRIHATATDAPTLQKILPVAGSRSGQLTTKTPKRLANLTGSLTDRPTFLRSKAPKCLHVTHAPIFFCQWKNTTQNISKETKSSEIDETTKVHHTIDLGSNPRVPWSSHDFLESKHTGPMNCYDCWIDDHSKKNVDFNLAK